MENLQLVNLAFTVLLGLVAFFGGFTIKGMSDAIKDLSKADERLRDKMDGFVRVDVLESWRKEQRDDTKLLFKKLDEIRDNLSHKVDRDECSNCRKVGQ
jgi:hypothetical protein